MVQAAIPRSQLFWESSHEVFFSLDRGTGGDAGGRSSQGSNDASGRARCGRRQLAYRNACNHTRRHTSYRRNRSGPFERVGQPGPTGIVSPDVGLFGVRPRPDLTGNAGARHGGARCSPQRGWKSRESDGPCHFRTSCRRDENPPSRHCEGSRKEPARPGRSSWRSHVRNRRDQEGTFRCYPVWNRIYRLHGYEADDRSSQIDHLNSGWRESKLAPAIPAGSRSLVPVGANWSASCL